MKAKLFRPRQRRPLSGWRWFGVSIVILITLVLPTLVARGQVVPPIGFPIQIANGGASWTFNNALGIHPAFNQLDPGRPGFGLEAALLTGNANTALDTSYTIWLDNQQFVASEPITASAAGLTIGPVITSGVSVQLQFQALSGQPVLRGLISVSNPSIASITRSFRVANNAASDNVTLIPTGGTSSGDGLLSLQDRWAITSEDRDPLLNPVNVHVFAGPGAPLALPTAVSTRVYLDPPSELDPGSTGLNGVSVTFSVTIPAGATRRLLFFHQLAPTDATALNAAARYSSNLRQADALLSGLSLVEMSEVVNWALPAYEVFLPLIQR